MTTIKLNRYYPHMTESITLEVSDEIAVVLSAGGRQCDSYKRRKREHNECSLDVDPGFEPDVMFPPLTPEEIILDEHSGYAQIHFAAVGRMDANIEITEQIPVLQGPVQIPAQTGEVTDQQNVNVPIHRLIMKFQQAGAVVEFQSACYIAGSPNDFKAMLLCVEVMTAMIPPGRSLSSVFIRK